VRLYPLGVRGSCPAPGLPFARWGGHTSCVAVLADGEQTPRLVLDAGSGLSLLPTVLGDAPFAGTIVLTHLHWDHMQGLPFCRSVDNPAAEVTLYLPVEGAADARQLLARGFSPPHFPIGPDGLRGNWTFRATPAEIDDAGVEVAAIAHKGGLTHGIRVNLDGAALAYLPDHALHGATSAIDRERAERLVFGADVLLHDGQYIDAEESIARDYGHATIDHVLEFADRSRVGSLVLTHHAPTRTDDVLDALAERFRRTPEGRPVKLARQGEPIEVTRP
jgi:ribonuclease BN (tRNA processing enzyme)